MPTSTVGSSQAFDRGHFAPHGFTLVELLVVLAIMAFATLAVAPSLQRLVAPRPARPAVEQLLTAIGRSRDEAIQRRQTFRGAFDPGSRSWQDTAGNVLFQLPEEMSIVPEGGPTTDPLPCVFRPDGSGCTLSLNVAQDGQDWKLKVDPVTGRIRLLHLVGP